MAMTRTREAGLASDFRPAITVPPVVARLGVIALIVLVWELSARFVVDPMFLSPPSIVLLSIRPMLAEPGVLDAILGAAYQLAVAFSLSVVVGLVLGLLIGIPRFAYLTLLPIVILLYAIPQSTLLPVFTILFGIGPAAKIAYGFSHGVFPILVTVIAAVQNIRPVFIVSARSMGANGFQVLRHVVVPSIVPAFFTGLRLGMASTLIGVLLAELYISDRGIGYFSRYFALSFDPSSLFALIVVISAMAVIVNELLRRIELRFDKWRLE